MSQKATTPKKRNAEKTRAKILASAQKLFSERGYTQAGIRDIAALADVSSPMLLRYFGTKAGLFEQALMEATRIDALLSIDRAEFGNRFARLLTSTQADQTAPSIVALSVEDAEARKIATQVTLDQVLEPLAGWLGPPSAKNRALKIIIMGMGFQLFYSQIPILSAVKGSEKEIVRWFAESIQAIVDESGAG